MAKAIPKAKGKIKREALAEEEQAIKDWEEKQYLEDHKPEKQVGKVEITTKEVLNILADEVEEIYEMNGAKIDRMNSMEKARTLYLEIRYKMGASVKEKEFQLPDCGKHE